MSAGIAALACTMAVVAWPAHGRDPAGVPSAEPTPRRGLAVTLALVAASLKAGAGTRQALERHLGEGLDDVDGDLDVDVVRQRLRRCRLDEETGAEVDEVAHGLRAAVLVSRMLGCPLARCVEAVRSSAARMRLREDLRRNAFAMPASTMRLLLGLPVVVLVLGELMGAHPLCVLFGSWQGALLLVLGMGCYASGVAWMRRLVRASGP